MDLTGSFSAFLESDSRLFFFFLNIVWSANSRAFLMFLELIPLTFLLLKDRHIWSISNSFRYFESIFNFVCFHLPLGTTLVCSEILIIPSLPSPLPLVLPPLAGSYYVVQASLKLVIQPRLALNLWQSFLPPLILSFPEFSFGFWPHVLTPAAQQWICILEEMRTLATSRFWCGCSLASPCSWWLGIRWLMELHWQIPKVSFLWSLLCAFQLLHLWTWALPFCRAVLLCSVCLLPRLCAESTYQQGSLLSGISPVFLFHIQPSKACYSTAEQGLSLYPGLTYN